MCNFRNSFKYHNNMGQLTNSNSTELVKQVESENFLFKVVYFDMAMPIENLIYNSEPDKKVNVNIINHNMPIFNRYTENIDNVTHLFFNRIFEEHGNGLYFTREFRDIIDITMHKGNTPIIYINHNELVLFNNLREKFEHDLEQENTTSVDGYRLLNLLNALNQYQSKLQIRTVEYEYIGATSMHVINSDSFTIRRFVPNEMKFKVVEEETILI